MNVVRCRVPVHEHRLDLRSQEMIGARGSEFRQPRAIMTANETEHRIIVLYGRNVPLRSGQLTAQERKNVGEEAPSVRFGKGGMLRTAKRSRTSIVFLNIASRLINDFEGSLVTGFVVVAP